MSIKYCKKVSKPQGWGEIYVKRTNLTPSKFPEYDQKLYESTQHMEYKILRGEIDDEKFAHFDSNVNDNDDMSCSDDDSAFDFITHGHDFSAGDVLGDIGSALGGIFSDIFHSESDHEYSDSESESEQSNSPVSEESPASSSPVADSPDPETRHCNCHR